MRLILSRKGFDAAHGGIPSPILPDGRLCPLPIPDERSPFRYDSLSIAGVPLRKLLADLRPKRLQPIEFAHLDPDLDYGSMSRPAGWRPMLGQAGAAYAHLRNQGVGIGDLFLFFGWFREVALVDGRYQYISGSPDRHVIYGWLEVGAIWPVDEKKTKIPAWVKSHVHFQRARGKKQKEAVFVASEEMSLPGLTGAFPGAGLAAGYRPTLCLTAAGHSRSIWRLPGWFMPAEGKRPLSYHGNIGRWEREGEDALLKTQSRGQEFVLQGENFPKMAAWVSGILTDMIHS